MNLPDAPKPTAPPSATHNQLTQDFPFNTQWEEGIDTKYYTRSAMLFKWIITAVMAIIDLHNDTMNQVDE